jgi:hypothetical protein
MSARLLADFEPGSLTMASTGPVAVGAGQCSGEFTILDSLIAPRLAVSQGAFASLHEWSR